MYVPECPTERVCTYRTCDVRWPFLWADESQPPERWHGPGEGPVHYLAGTAKGAWAETLRHEGITALDHLLDLDRALWEVDAAKPSARPNLAHSKLVGVESSYSACQAEARRLRAAGAIGLTAPSAALASGQAEQFGVAPSGQFVVGHFDSDVVVVFGMPGDLSGVPLAEGHPDPVWLSDIRRL